MTDAYLEFLKRARSKTTTTTKIMLPTTPMSMIESIGIWVGILGTVDGFDVVGIDSLSRIVLLRIGQSKFLIYQISWMGFVRADSLFDEDS